MSFAFFVAFVSNKRDGNRTGLFTLSHCLGELAANVQCDVEALSVVDGVHDDEGVDRADPAGGNVSAVVHSRAVVDFKPELGLKKDIFFYPFAVGGWNMSEIKGLKRWF